MPTYKNETAHPDHQGRFCAPGIVVIKRLCTTTLFILLILGLVYPVVAQPSETITIQPPNLENFPLIQVAFQALDANNQPLPDLELSQLTVLENSSPVEITSLTSEYQGVHFALAINGNRELDVHDVNGFSRYEKLIQPIRDWTFKRTFQGEDTWFLVTDTGVANKSTGGGKPWADALDLYQPNFRLMQPDLTSLTSALQLLSQEVVPLGVDKALLYITPPPTPEQIAPINTLTAEARAAGIRVNVWMVGDALFLDNDQGGALINLAANAGGQFFFYTGIETFPDPDTLITSLGNLSMLTYHSKLQETGTYPLEIQVALADKTISGQSQPFYIEILPPNPILISPPARIVREITAEAEQPNSFKPATHPLSIMVEFPDGHTRPLVASRLLVDGVAVAINASPPFDTFDWDLTTLTDSDEHTIQVLVEDSLGLTASTLLTPVQIEVRRAPEPTPWSVQQVGLLITGVITVVALVLLVVWLVRRGWLSPQGRQLRSQLPPLRRETAIAPLKESHLDDKTSVYLLPLYVLSHPDDPAAIAITQRRVFLGSDPDQVDILLSDSTVDAVQAEIIFHAGEFWLHNLGGHSPVWINYELIGTEQVLLRAGDVLHFGNLGFRFTIHIDESIPQVTVSKYEPLL